MKGSGTGEAKVVQVNDNVKPHEQEIHHSKAFHPMTLPRSVSNALYVADLDPAVVTETLLFDLFSQVGTVLSLKLCTNPKSSAKSPLPCHAYINFNTVEEACNAWQTLNYKDLNGTPMRILFSNLDPASRYNKNANLYIKNLEESIDSEALHNTFSVIGVVLSCKVERDTSSGKSLGYGFVQFQDEEDAQEAIRFVNGKLLAGKKVYLGLFIPRSATDARTLDLAAMNMNPLDLNPAHNKAISSTISNRPPSPDTQLSLEFGTTNLTEVATSSDEEDQDPSSSSNDDVDYEASRMLARARAADMISTARDAVLAQKRARLPHVDPTYVPSSEPWPPQPWSVTTLRTELASSHLPEERVAKLGATLFPLVWKYIDTFVSDVTNELIKTLDIEDIVHLMESAEDLREKVEQTKDIIVKRIRNQPPFVPKTRPLPITSPPPPPPSRPSTPTAGAIGEAPAARGLPVWNMWIGILQPGTNVQKGTGFFDVSLTPKFRNHKIRQAQDHVGSRSQSRLHSS